MNRARLLVSMLLVSLLSGLLGCDVAVVAVLMSRKSGSSKTPAPAPGADLTFKLWVAELGGLAGATEQATIDTNNGDPDPIKWTLLASATTSGEYTMPTPTTTGFNAILIQATVNQVYEVDSIEILDSTGTTTQTGDATTIFANSEITAIPLKDAQGPPDGVGTLTNATAAKRSFIFMKQTASILTFRVNLWPQNSARASGDVEWSRSFDQGNDLAGGAALNSQGVIHIVFREAGNIWLLRYDQNGAIVPDLSSNNVISLASGVTVSATTGSQAVAIDKNNQDVVYLGLTRNAGDIQVQKFNKDFSSQLWVPPLGISTSGIDRIERNGLAVTPNGSLVVVGGIDYGGANGVGHYIHRFLPDRSDAWVAATPPTPPVDPNDTYWYGVAITSDQDFFTCGNATALVPPTDIDINVSRIQDLVSTGGGISEKWNIHNQGTSSHTALGRAIGTDGINNVYTAGYYTVTGLDSVIVRFDPVTGAANSHFLSSRAGDDEFLDIAVETDGTIYATGYETNSSHKHLVLYKIGPNKAILWKRTLNTAGFDDQGVKVLTTATHAIVVGQIGITAGNLDIHVRKYVK